MRNEKTSKRVARIASKQLRGKTTGSKAKTTAGSALTQAPNRSKKARKK
jgi:hypothetical protein